LPQAPRSKIRPNRPDRSLPFDSDFRAKDAIFAIQDSFDRRPLV
jgi:hypothetical protein